jgi:hypothetical protein
MKHCYIKVTDDSGREDVYGLIGNEGTAAKEFQRIRKNEVGSDGEDRNTNGGKNFRGCTDVPGTECQKKKLIAGMEAQIANNGKCPSCEDNYEAWKPTDLVHFFDGYNSNTWVYNMILGAGMTPPAEGLAPGYHQALGQWCK